MQRSWVSPLAPAPLGSETYLSRRSRWAGPELIKVRARWRDDAGKTRAWRSIVKKQLREGTLAAKAQATLNPEVWYTYVDLMELLGSGRSGTVSAMHLLLNRGMAQYRDVQMGSGKTRMWCVARLRHQNDTPLYCTPGCDAWPLAQAFNNLGFTEVQDGIS